jgi:hypothetical protein
MKGGLRKLAKSKKEMFMKKGGGVKVCSSDSNSYFRVLN